jgi:nucleoside-diphosphate-sugar epimerase
VISRYEGPSCPDGETGLEELLSRPGPGLADALAQLQGDLLVLGGGGKIGPTLAMMARRALDQSGRASRVLSVSRWTDSAVRGRLEGAGVETVEADLADPDSYRGLPDAAAVIYLVGHKFGSSTDAAKTWWTNAVVPAFSAARYRGVPTVVFSTGNVYPLRSTSRGGMSEHEAPDPVGAYAQSCLAREEVYRHAAVTWGTPVTLFRLNYAAELRYGVLCDIASKVMEGEPVDVSMPAVNLVWQGDASRWALRSLELASPEVVILNATGPETLSIRAIALEIARLTGRPGHFVGEEAADALLSDAGYCHHLYGYPSITPRQLIAWTVDWLTAGGHVFGKPTKFQQRDGQF